MHAIYILDCEGISCVMLVHSVLCTVTRLVYSLVLECFPLRVCASPFQEEKKNLKRRDLERMPHSSGEKKIL